MSPLRMSSAEPPADSPWGLVQLAVRLADGIFFCETAGHGGVWLSPERRHTMPKGHRSRAWYEEDCEAAIPLWWYRKVLRHRYAEDRDPALLDWLRRWNPEFAAAFENSEFTPCES